MIERNFDYRIFKFILDLLKIQSIKIIIYEHLPLSIPTIRLSFSLLMTMILKILSSLFRPLIKMMEASQIKKNRRRYSIKFLKKQVELI